MIAAFFDEAVNLVKSIAPEQPVGMVRKITGLVVHATGLKVPLGSICEISATNRQVIAEVVGFDDDEILLMPFSETLGISPGASVKTVRQSFKKPQAFDHQFPLFAQNERFSKKLPVGDELLGRIVDSTGTPLDDGPTPMVSKKGLNGKPINPLQRAAIRTPLDVGVKAINAMLTVGKGQRIGLFAGSGVGKSVLLGMMARYTKADRVVVGLIGERGREVKEFIEESLGEEGLAKSVVVAAPADQSPLLRLQGADYCTTIAEHFRDQGHDVLLLMDSLTRYAMAQREIALSIGEPPVTKGYPASVFAKLPTLVERTGNAQEGQGSITAFYTVLTEGDDQQDPVADSARAILDGHIVLSRALADSGHYPAIDIEKSISRVMQSIVSKGHMHAARILKSKFSKVQNNRDLIAVGAYTKGADKDLDLAIEMYPYIEKLLQQEMDTSSTWAESLSLLENLMPDAFAQSRSGAK